MTLVEFQTVNINNWRKDKIIFIEHTNIAKITDGWGGGTKIVLNNKDSFTVSENPDFIEAYIKSTVEASTKNSPTMLDIYEAQNETNEILKKILEYLETYS